ncbi:hypothetical protein KR018_011455 [Drosophila ironensis]|nr:hypothetical protein KR018_011455 [Drosophila ironensis]
MSSSARAITCYECDSVNNPGCGEKFAGDDIATTDCEVVAYMHMLAPGIEPTCLVKYYEGMPGEKIFVRRSCYYGDSSPTGIDCDESPDPVVPYLNFLGCQACNADLCNGAGDRIPVFVTTALLGVLAILAT